MDIEELKHYLYRNNQTGKRVNGYMMIPSTKNMSSNNLNSFRRSEDNKFFYKHKHIIFLCCKNLYFVRILNNNKF